MQYGQVAALDAATIASATRSLGAPSPVSHHSSYHIMLITEKTDMNTYSIMSKKKGFHKSTFSACDGIPFLVVLTGSSLFNEPIGTGT